MKRWTKQELKFLKENYRKFSYVWISERLCRSTSSIYWKAYILKLNKGRWDDNNRLNKDKIIKMLIKQKNKLGKSPSVREVPISLRSACQRHFGNFNKAKKAANLEIKKHKKSLPQTSYKPSKELAYIVGLVLGDGSFRYQKYKERTSYAVVFATKDKDLMDFFLTNFERWSRFKSPKIYIVEGGYKKFPRGYSSHYNKAYYVQICSKDVWEFLKKFKDRPERCLEFFPRHYQNWLLKGLWDAEGCIRATDSRGIRIHFSNSDNEIISLYTNLLANYNFKYSINKTKSRGFNVNLLNNYEMIRFIRLINGITIRRKINKIIITNLSNIKTDQISFDQKVYNLVKQIPQGYVSTYRDIAQAMNCKAYRAVGQALKRNPYGAWGRVGGKSCRRRRCLVPCHRVVASDGGLGGYNGKMRSPKKIRLLKKEGIEIKNNKVVNFKKYLFRF